MWPDLIDIAIFKLRFQFVSIFNFHHKTSCYNSYNVISVDVRTVLLALGVGFEWFYKLSWKTEIFGFPTEAHFWLSTAVFLNEWPWKVGMLKPSLVKLYLQNFIDVAFFIVALWSWNGSWLRFAELSQTL